MGNLLRKWVTYYPRSAVTLCGRNLLCVLLSCFRLIIRTVVCFCSNKGFRLLGSAEINLRSLCYNFRARHQKDRRSKTPDKCVISFTLSE